MDLLVTIRTDASIDIGTGHVMRCLTLANTLKGHGCDCQFICRELKGNLIDQIEEQGFYVHRLNYDLSVEIKTPAARGGALLPSHAHWLGVPWQSDAEACRPILETLEPDWLIVDHYALDARWEAEVCPPKSRLLVIDDLSDREHLADVLLDQNLGRKREDYTALVPEQCLCLIGAEFALLRPEFAHWRDLSLARRRQQPRLKQLLISLGGVDKDNVTGRILGILKKCRLPDECEISVIMGGTSPWVSAVKAQVNDLPWTTEVVVGVSDIGRRMAEADLAIGAAGSTSWERCCLGLPTLMVVLADNQREIAEYLEMVGASLTLPIDSLEISLRNGLLKMEQPAALLDASDCCARITDGGGSERVMKRLITNSISE